MKKGFTLIELIAIIVILGIILSIAVPNVADFISKSYGRSCAIDIKAMEVAAKGYVITKNIKIEDGSNKIILVDSMVDEGLIDPIIDPKNKGKCDGYVEVKRNNKNYDYKGYINCKNSCITDGYGYGDTFAPIITILGKNPVNYVFGESYIDAGATALDNIDGDVTSRIQTESTINPAIPGPYTVTYTVTDSVGNPATAIRNVFIIDNINPTITFGTNGNATWAKTRSSTVTVTDTGGVNTSSLKYQWTTSATQPTEASFSSTFTNGGTISSPAGVTGGYYLWVIGKDNRSNTTISGTNVFNLDNTVPVITMNGNNPIVIAKDSTYSDAGATATDAHSGINGSVTSTGTINTNVPGTYTITYNANDRAGNVATQVTRTVNVISPPVYTFYYTGSYQSFTALYTGTYKLEVWGAQGGTGKVGGGAGGYAQGNISLTSGQILYVFVGAQGQAGGTSAYNGGGIAPSCGYYCAAGGGGGATDIRYGGTNLTNRIIVAGGGGGGGDGVETFSVSGVGGNGGGSTGFDGGTAVDTKRYDYAYGGGAGTQTSGGVGGSTTVGSGAVYSFGEAGYGGQGGTSGIVNNGGGGGGGGGYYGGGGGSSYVYNFRISSGGGGGSGYIGGVTNGSMLTGVNGGNGFSRITYIP